MKVYLIPGPGEPGMWLAGPGDLEGKRGRLVLLGDPDERSQCHWAIALGLFAGRGGSIEWGYR